MSKPLGTSRPFFRVPGHDRIVANAKNSRLPIAMNCGSCVDRVLGQASILLRSED